MTELFPVLLLRKGLGVRLQILGVLFQFALLRGHIRGILHAQVRTERGL